MPFPPLRPYFIFPWLPYGPYYTFSSSLANLSIYAFKYHVAIFPLKYYNFPSSSLHQPSTVNMLFIYFSVFHLIVSSSLSLLCHLSFYSENAIYTFQFSILTYYPHFHCLAISLNRLKLIIVPCNTSLPISSLTPSFLSSLACLILRSFLPSFLSQSASL